MKKLAIAVAVLGALLTGQKALALTTATIDVYAQIDNTISVAVTPGNTYYNFGTLNTGVVVPASTAVNVTNNGGGLNETFGLMLANPLDWTVIMAGAPGPEQFKLDAAWDTDGAGIVWNDVNTTISLVNQNSTGVKYAGDQTGLGVPMSGVRNLWFRLSTPASTVAPAQQRIVVTVTASAS